MSNTMRPFYPPKTAPTQRSEIFGGPASESSYNAPQAPQAQQYQVTTAATIAQYEKGTIVPLPDFEPGKPLVARLCRPSITRMLTDGSIPNQLMDAAVSLFETGSQADSSEIDMQEMMGILYHLASEAMMEPTIEELESVGWQLTDDQLLAIFAFVNGGVEELNSFR